MVDHAGVTHVHPTPNVQQPEVLVVGAGPAGLAAAIVLARYNLPVLVVEKRPALGDLPRALVISTRTMEILRSWGLEKDVRSGAADVIPRGWVTETLSSGQGVEISLGYPSADEAASISPTRPAWAPQDHLEPLLLDHLRTYPSAMISFGTELITLDQQNNEIVAMLRKHPGGMSHEVRPQFVIGADGAHSTVRAQLGIEMEGPDSLAEFHRVLFRAPIARRIPEPHYGLNVITHPHAAGVLAPSGCHDRWGFAREWTPGQDRLALYGIQQLRELTMTAAGIPDLQVEIDGVNEFTFAAQIAERYQIELGFLIGDAAHRMTPRGGTGMNTAIHDAFDIGWKLAWVLRGWASAALLATYEAERRPIGLHNVRRSAEPNGARQEQRQALTYDLNGRVAHRWLPKGDTNTSTLDLLGQGVTVFAAPAGPDWATVMRDLNVRVPVVTHVLDPVTAQSLAIAPGSALLLRPDGQELVRWPTSAADRDAIPQSLHLL
jgi:2-polyprenyl-6-methoxyphenol hydroxylase-like FAD-dependent oxidoreductase